MYIDSHCHLTLSQYDEDRDYVLGKIKESGCQALIEVSIDVETSDKMMELFRDDDFFYFALGYHPHSVDKYDESVFEHYRSLLKKCDRIKAIGEIGLDCKSPHSLEKQMHVYESFVRFAKNLNLPIVIHHRGYDDEILKPLYDGALNNVIFHCFSSGPKMLKKVVDIGAYVSFSGIVTFKKAFDVKEAARIAPLDRIIVETDSPFLAPQQFRGRRNTPLNAVEVLKEIAAIKQMPIKELTSIVYANTLRAFDIS